MKVSLLLLVGLLGCQTKVVHYIFPFNVPFPEIEKPFPEKQLLSQAVSEENGCYFHLRDDIFLSLVKRGNQYSFPKNSLKRIKILRDLDVEKLSHVSRHQVLNKNYFEGSKEEYKTVSKKLHVGHDLCMIKVSEFISVADKEIDQGLWDIPEKRMFQQKVKNYFEKNFLTSTPLWVKVFFPIAEKYSVSESKKTGQNAQFQKKYKTLFDKESVTDSEQFLEEHKVLFTEFKSEMGKLIEKL